MPAQVLKVHPADNIIVALTDLKAGQEVSLDGQKYTTTTTVPAKHKFAAQYFDTHDEVTMYGVLVGKAMKPIAQGEAITTQNLAHAAQDFGGRQTQTTDWHRPDVSAFEGRTFNGYYRSNGSVGTANYWLVVPMVFCENRNLQIMKEALVDELGYGKASPYKQYVQKMMQGYQTGGSFPSLTIEHASKTAGSQRVFENVDGVKFLTHQAGCGGTRSDAEALCGLLAGYITHPNVAGVTVLSLGCQHAQVQMLKDEIVKRDVHFDKPMFVFEQQKMPSEQALLEEALKVTLQGIAQANTQTRQPAPVDKLVIGLECGGSDGFSGISANPSVGHVSDMIVAMGGTTVLSEFPELCGVEQELVNRCPTDELAAKFSHLMRTYEQRAQEAGSGFEANPSPGNIKDGLITDAIKSAGAAKKGGTSPVADVLDYPEKAINTGLNLLCTPGNDVESTTGLAAAGCNIILFTTGLGTPTGNPVCPVIKVASNHALQQRMPDIIDFSTGSVITGETTIAQTGEQLLDKIIAVASGEPTKAMQLGQDDFIPWKRGVSL